MEGAMIRERLAKNWWVFLLRGVLAILFGIGAILLPGITLAVLITLYGAYALADGVIAAVAAFTRSRAGEGFPWSLLLIGLAGIAIGILTFMYPGLTALVLLYFIAAWYVLRGMSEIVVAFRLRKEIQGEGWLMAAGALSVLFGLFLFIRPGAGALAVVWMIGAFAILFGVILVALGFKLKGLKPASA
jgi:uncharacterized membrane protein HdeD (DUF308 family)